MAGDDRQLLNNFYAIFSGDISCFRSLREVGGLVHGGMVDDGRLLGKAVVWMGKTNKELDKII